MKCIYPAQIILQRNTVLMFTCLVQTINYWSKGENRLKQQEEWDSFADSATFSLGHFEQTQFSELQCPFP